jgi:hypothetical protein
MPRHVDRERLPPDRTVVQFDFRDPAKRYWLVLERSNRNSPPGGGVRGSATNSMARCSQALEEDRQ